ncbi:SPOR domain-containing protein [Paenirhodobacter sp.]|uniref:SPOR domain-containing protein n=1 Tax=Paenirhodobacter sp. TaxID=1965326 RepID=UPI003B415374
MINLRALAVGLMAALPVAAGPVELPPPEYAGAQYVDSAGCVFRRDAAGQWQARLTRDGQPLCGYTPSPVPGAPRPLVQAAPQRVTITETRTVPGALTSCPNRPAMAQRYLLSDGRVVMRCSSLRGDPVGFINAAGLPGLRVEGPAPGPLPATPRMTVLLDLALRNPLPEAPRAHVPAKIRKQGRERFVQIGAFGDPENAQKVKAQIWALGLPVATSTLKRGGKELELIFSGPFDAKGADQAVRKLRRNGFRDAFVR